VPNYWGAKLPVNAGRDNFDTLRVDYYRDGTVALEAFKAGQYDFRQENEARKWATAYTGPAMSQGLIKKEDVKHEIPTGMQAYAFNERRPIFQDRRVRQAIGYAFDFEWSNKNLFFGAYTRTKSYFSNSELASSGLPTGEELKILEPFRSQLPPEVFTKEFEPPKTDGSGNLREHLREALALLTAAGWTVKGQKLVNAKGEQLQFEMLGADPAFERISLPFTKNLERLGIVAKVRTVDSAQFQNRVERFDFDVIVTGWGQSLSPGNEQRDFWHSAVADVQGSRNYPGIKDPVVDKLIDLVIAAPDRAGLIARTKALDRVLLWGHHVIPHFHIQTHRVAYWDKFGRPSLVPKYSLGFDTWWVDAKKAGELDRKKSAASK
jgi:microcin C transport system substrate-binding protein